MTQVLCQLPKPPQVPQLLVGNETSDDAGIYQLTDEIALVQTIDYFTPIVDDPYLFGQIAAANALSDVFAMGGTPKTALNIVGFPVKKLGADVLAEILKGAADKVHEANAVTVGGHSIDDQEPKFGLAVTGIVHPEKFWKNTGAKCGDVLVLTKPIGVGIMTTGIKRGVVSTEQEQQVITVMSELNKQAAELLHSFHPHAVTDVTGFGLLGHASEMAQGSQVTFEIEYSRIPQLDGTFNLCEQGVVPGGSKANQQFVNEMVEYDASLSISEQLILCDAITSGGLLISLPMDEAKEYVDQLKELGNQYVSIIGNVTGKKEKAIIVKP